MRGAVYEAPTTSAPALVQDPTMAAALPLAWSAETVDLAAADSDETVYDTAYARPDIRFDDDSDGAGGPDYEPLAWYRRPGVLFA
ncbi:hypothetical protein C6A85_36930, partial [Mycobacterium sp. ITM-2017-0098]